jgi:hypothetical protein
MYSASYNYFTPYVHPSFHFRREEGLVFCLLSLDVFSFLGPSPLCGYIRSFGLFFLGWEWDDVFNSSIPCSLTSYALLDLVRQS